jgi:hypothetical protein
MYSSRGRVAFEARRSSAAGEELVEIICTSIKFLKIYNVIKEEMRS